jgi:phosphoribosylamine--glycine ligase
MSKENTVVVIGSGGAESALVQKYGQSPYVDRIIAIPGNDMMQELVPEKTVVINPLFKIGQTDAIVDLLSSQSKEIAFVDIRDEQAIATGMSNKLWAKKIRSCSPNWQGGRHESDKAYTRDLMQDLGVKQPVYDKLHFKNGETQKSHNAIIERYGRRKSFVKANGLANGKGVIGANNSSEIHTAIEKLRYEYPQATEKILIERALMGEELSAFAICAGGEYRILGYAQDHKRVFDNDKGPNTGGMGAISNPSLSNNLSLQEGIEETFRTTVENRWKRGNGYRAKGILYQGVMAVEEEGQLVPYFLEYNARWGDPEAQVLLPGLTFDLFELNDAVADNYMPDIEFSNDGKDCRCGSVKRVSGRLFTCKGA